MAGPSRHQDAAFDSSLMAENVLDHILDDTSDIANAERAKEVAVEEELKKKKLLEAESNRIRSRVLFVTNDQSVLEKGSERQAHLLELTEVFDEIHVIVLSRVGQQKRQTVRLAPKVWVYPAASRWFLRQTAAAESIARNQLEFTDGFRADIVVALDPFESAMAAMKIARRFDRPWQVHVTDDVFLDEKKFLAQSKDNKQRLRYLSTVMKRADSVRVSTESLKAALEKRFTKIPDLALLPRYFNVRYLLSVPTEPDKDLFPQFAFTMLFIGELGTESTLHRTLDAVRAILQTPSIGLVVIGEGSRREQFRQRAQLLGISKQVLFFNSVPDIVPILQSADLLIVTDTSTPSDEMVIKAAAAGTPMVMARTALRDDLFSDALDTFLVDPDDTLTFHKRIYQFINANALRTQFANNGRQVVQSRIEEDPRMFRLAYRDSIEKVLYFEEAEMNAKEQAAKPAPPPPPKTVIVDGMEMRVPGGG